MSRGPCPARCPVVVTQPAAAGRCCQTLPRDWRSGLLDCNSDSGICVLGSVLPCVLACQVAMAYGECCCVPFLPGALVAMRTGLREQRRIRGCVCCDWAAVCCCCPCALCQLAREIQGPC
ncbi:cornifelin [Alligator mississippiensis]|uniref:Cornifelin n=1 Tax=Alligator mississippiensis TaxID=8496 RepID=A0A151P8U2_ALLMI|nr:cornifelin [Alligator mississippiensis]KYO45329.1 cornifelin [Alligator mississippiensis]